MKISRKMYNKETKDCQLFIQFNNKEYDLIKNKGFIQEEYICATSISAMYKANMCSGIVKFGMEHTNNYIIPFQYEYCEWNNNVNDMEYNIIFFENKKFKYGKDKSFETVQKRFVWDLIIHDILKPKFK